MIFLSSVDKIYRYSDIVAESVFLFIRFERIPKILGFIKDFFSFRKEHLLRFSAVWFNSF